MVTHHRHSAQKQIRHNSHTQTAVAWVTNANFTVNLETKLPLWLLPSIHQTDFTYMLTAIQQKPTQREPYYYA